MLTIDRLTVAFGPTVAVDAVSFDLDEGQVLAVLGPSGCGKSTLLRAIAGLERSRSGRVVAEGEDLTGVPTHRRGFALMFQDGQLFPHLSVARNVAYPLRLRHVPPDERRRRVVDLLDLVGLPGYAERDPTTLSGGEQQRVALARALAVRPRLLLLDEPLSALDRSLRERLAVDLREILHAAGTTALLVTHDHDEAFAVADRMGVMRQGRLMQEGSLAEVWRHPADPPTARFLGYAAVVSGARATPLLRLVGRGPGGDAIALRRSALKVDPEGSLRGVVVSARLSAEQARLVVEVDGVGRLDAVAGLGVPVRAGDSVPLALDPSRVAFVPVAAPGEPPEA